MIDTIIHAEALATLKTMADNSVDSIVCDPPAGIHFMSREFDHDKGGRDHWIAWLRDIMAEALRVIKPGGHAFVWALPRTSHWTATALEDAGWEVRDSISHFYGTSTLVQSFLNSLTPSQQDAFNMLLDSQDTPAIVAAMFGSGFPKSMDVSKAIDKMAGAEREVVGKSPIHSMGNRTSFAKRPGEHTCEESGRQTPYTADRAVITAPATDAARQYAGYGTALKPSSEHWILCRKPLSEPTIAANVLKWGCGALDIDSTRVAHNEPIKPMKAQATNNCIIKQSGRYEDTTELKAGGRWPANTVLSHSLFCTQQGTRKVSSNRWGTGNGRYNHAGNQGYHGNVKDFMGIGYEDSDGMEEVAAWQCVEGCPVAELDRQSGVRKSKAAPRGGTSPNPMSWGKSRIDGDKMAGYDDIGGSSRYFNTSSSSSSSSSSSDIVPFIYQAKASRAERNRGCEGLPLGVGGCLEGNADMNNARKIGARPDIPVKPTLNSHPTVKSIALLRHFIRMITPPGGIVLDCFAGSGSTCVAAIHEHRHFIAIEMNDTETEPYVSIARARIAQAYKDVGHIAQEGTQEWDCAEDCPVRVLGEQSGVSKSTSNTRYNNAHKPNAYGNFNNPRVTGGHDDEGTAARFFNTFPPDSLWSFEEVEA